MLIKIDHTVSSAISEDRGSVVDQLTISKRMYSWVEGESVGRVADSFAVANPKATFGDFIEWTKRTYMERLTARENGETFSNFRLIGDYNPTASREGVGEAKFAQHGVSAINDAAHSSQKPRKVAEPGQEHLVDAADEAALSGESPITPPTDLSDLKPVEAGQQADKPSAIPPIGGLEALKARK